MRSLNDPVVNINATSRFMEVFGNLIVANLSGSFTNGEAYVCVYDNGTLFAKDSACS